MSAARTFPDSLPDISRYTEWSVVSRTVIIDRFIENLLKDGIDTVINLGAGLDARPCRMKLPETKRGWVEQETCYSGEIALEFNRKPPMSRLVELVLPFLPEKVQKDSIRPGTQPDSE